MDTGRRALLAATGTALAGTAGCASALGIGRSRTLDDDEYDVGMSSTAFLPERHEVEVGDTVVWYNSSSRAHTVTAYEDAIPDDAAYFASGGFDDESTARDSYFDGFGGSIPSRGTYEHTFEVPGEYGYFCVPHEDGEMIGTIVVRE